MKQFAFVFRGGGRELSETEAAQRTKEIGQWARSFMASGSEFDARVFRGDKYHVTQDDSAEITSATEQPVIAINFITANDLEDAVRIAQTHPGLRYGSSIEVSEWFSPLAASGT